MRRLSVVITNYNYARFVGTAVESALGLRWDDIEVVVVDDGSTDDSPEVLRRYADRVQLHFTANGGQREAANHGFAACSGDVVIFLDADDVLPPELAERLAAVWSPTVSKVQFRMQRIDAAGVPFGRPFPEWRRVPTPGQVRRWVERTSAQPTPPGSGNAYARWFLERIFPLDPSLGRAADSGCLAAAPLHGDVLTLPDVVVGYRQHGGNDSDLLADDTRFSREVVTARARWRFAQRSVGVPEDQINERPLRRSRELLQLRIAGSRLAPGRALLPDDGRRRLLLDVLVSPAHPGPEPLRTRLLIAGWCLSVLTAPQALVRGLVIRRWRRP
ncbi:glycosyltransferase family 2 protein [Geodermatophilus obscurus]|uniref:Glycosyl transferase family 2 n=1 Tax=Geodermatophilus obscurus (strain ATCC 25078 / DSM 43160 / JCM 3152 / CCUG 61914 / KCC A-0152 / KCTC 9177 / NBRC 13315 / NRRL B-3577 / G-20) TaxID=526225 RepID=D2S575_GEOOG|nr:glycosyltransferase family 2 protein [Geodermatophilus obscurus]ADB73186.1 glycosyl transferase family 2 [Geodermatophilus obscurus DSM 43160]